MFTNPKLSFDVKQDIKELIKDQKKQHKKTGTQSKYNSLFYKRLDSEGKDQFNELNLELVEQLNSKVILKSEFNIDLTFSKYLKNSDQGIKNYLQNYFQLAFALSLITRAEFMNSRSFIEKAVNDFEFNSLKRELEIQFRDLFRSDQANWIKLQSWK